MYCYLEFKLCYLKNLKLFSIRVEELFVQGCILGGSGPPGATKGAPKMRKKGNAITFKIIVISSEE